MVTKTIPFDLETAKKIQTGEIKGKIKRRDGRAVRIICRDRISKSQSDLVLEVPDNEPQFKPFDKVLVRYPDKTELCVPNSAWLPGVFQYKSVNSNLYFVSGKAYKDCIPYEGNEHLVGTTDEPKE